VDSSFAADSIIINDNDLPTVSIVASTPNATESSGSPGEFTVTRTGPTGQPLTVYYSWGSYAPLYASTDYQPLSGNVTIPAGQNSATIAVNPIAATGGPGGGIQPLTASLSTNPSNPSSYWISNENTAIVNFYGPLTPPILAYYADQPVTSPGSSTPAQFTIVCSTVAPSTVYYRVFAGPNGLVDGVDYSVVGQSPEEYHTATIPAGGSAVVSIDALTPAAAGCSFYLLLESPLSPYWQSYMGMGYSAVLYPLPTVAVAPIPTPELAVSDAVAVEGDAEVFTVSLSASATQSVSVPYSTWDGSAVSTGSGEIDYASTSGSVTVAPGGTAQITVPTDVGWLGGGDKGFTLDLGSVSGVSIPNNWAVGIMTPVTATLSLRTDYNDDGTINATDDFFDDLGPTPINVEGVGPRTLVDLGISLSEPVQNASGLMAVLPNVPGLDFWTVALGGTPLTPNSASDIVGQLISLNGTYTGTYYVSQNPACPPSGTAYVEVMIAQCEAAGQGDGGEPPSALVAVEQPVATPSCVYLPGMGKFLVSLGPTSRGNKFQVDFSLMFVPDQAALQARGINPSTTTAEFVQIGYVDVNPASAFRGGILGLFSRNFPLDQWFVDADAPPYYPDTLRPVQTLAPNPPGMTDQPGVTRAMQWAAADVLFQFETCVVVKAAATEYVLGALNWGFWSAGGAEKLWVGDLVWGSSIAAESVTTTDPDGEHQVQLGGQNLNYYSYVPAQEPSALMTGKLFDYF